MFCHAHVCTCRYVMFIFVRIYSLFYGSNCVHDNHKKKTHDKSEDLMNVSFNVCLVVYESGIE